MGPDFRGVSIMVFDRSMARSFVLGAIALLLVTSSASAQRGRGFRWLFGTSKVEIATLAEVQGDLKLSDEQKTRITEIYDQLRDDRRAMFGTGFGKASEIFQRSEALNAEAATKVEALLDDAQRKRLQEIAIQQNGPRSLHDPAVVELLELSDEQKAKLSGVRDENRTEFESAFAQHGREWRRQAGDLVEKFDERLLAVLTPEQRERFDQLAGERLEIDYSQLRGRR
jgi:Spy/CpxP family protein refolding chaperone